MLLASCHPGWPRRSRRSGWWSKFFLQLVLSGEMETTDLRPPVWSRLLPPPEKTPTLCWQSLLTTHPKLLLRWLMLALEPFYRPGNILHRPCRCPLHPSPPGPSVYELISPTQHLCLFTLSCSTTSSARCEGPFPTITFMEIPTVTDVAANTDDLCHWNLTIYDGGCLSSQPEILGIGDSISRFIMLPWGITYCFSCKVSGISIYIKAIFNHYPTVHTVIVDVGTNHVISRQQIKPQSDFESLTLTIEGLGKICILSGPSHLQVRALNVLAVSSVCSAR